MGDISDKISGKAKEMEGKMTDNKKQELQGKAKSDMADMKMKAKDAYHEAAHDLDD